MSRNVRNNLELLKALQKMNVKQRTNFLKDADPSLVLAICECALNTLKGNVPLKSGQKKKLVRFKKLLRALTKNPRNWKSKRRLLVQKGGALLPLLLSTALSALLSTYLK